MEYLIMAIILILIVILLKKLGKISIKKIKKLGEKKELDEIVSKFPKNKEICKSMLKMLENEKVKIKESEQNEASVYIVITDTIFIANIKNSYTRVQTIAHECLHSIQNKAILLFHFILSNIYLLYYALLMLVTVFTWVFKWQNSFLQNYWLQFSILAIMSFLLYMVKSYLESDAMIKAEILSKRYMEEQKVGTKKEQEILIRSLPRIIPKRCNNNNVHSFFKNVNEVSIIYNIDFYCFNIK